MSNPNDTAFPVSPVQNYEETLPAGGLTKREYFAAMAMQGLCVQFIPCPENLNYTAEASHKAEMAVRLADSLLAELAKVKS